MTTKNNKLRIAVVGGGLGGTTTAIILQHAGFDVKVFEQAPSLQRIGAGINLSPNVSHILRRIGLEDAVIGAGILPDCGIHRQWDSGEITYTLRYDEFPERYGAPHIILHRGDLQQVLNTGLVPGSLELGKRMVDLDEQGERIRLTFADRTTFDADLVIGADGINSRVREILLGPERPVYTGQVAYRAIFSAALLGGTRVPDSTKWWADDRYFLAYYLDQAHSEIYFVTGVPVPWDSDDFTPVPARPDDLRRAFDGFHPEVQTIIAACQQSIAWPVLFRDPYPLWSRGRIVLLGDAAHPMKPHMGQGAAMAIEDAAVLGRSLVHYGDDVAGALHVYETLRFARTSRVKQQSDKHEWMRYGSECDWLFGYDAFKVELSLPSMQV